MSACLAVAVARAVQLPRLPFLLAALAALTVYDAASVLLIGGTVQTAAVAAAPAATAAAAAASGAAAATAAATSSGGLASGVAAAASQSAMGAVAVAKVSGGLGGGGGLWQPGVFEVRVNGRISDLLGLGDAVFPALFAIWARRADTASSLSRSTSSEISSPSSSRSSSASSREPRGYYAASLAGFVVGCGACELAPSVAGKGLPALLVLLPTMLLAIGAIGTARDELRDLWEYDPAPPSKLSGDQ